MSNIFNIPVHPLADIFPMIDAYEFNELVDDIKEHGIQEPLVVSEIDGVLTLIDGRNRRAAAKEAGLDDIPTKNLNGTDPAQYIISANVMRRQLTKSQQAILHAMVKPIANSDDPCTGIGKNLLHRARYILNNDKDLADDVLIGKHIIDKAYESIKVKEGTKSEEHVLMRELRDSNPDLAEAVDNGTMKLVDALSEHHTRKADAKKNRVSMYNHLLNGLYIFSDECARQETRKELLGYLKESNAEFEEVTRKDIKDTVKRIKLAKRNIIKLLEEM